MIRLALYTLVDLLHDSPRAAVYRGFRNQDRLPVTVKLLAGDGGPRAIERLQNEYAILQSIDTPKVVRAVALEPYEGGLALVLRSPSGVPLDAILRSRTLDVVTATEIAVELARAVSAVHQAGIVHRDIKPGNVIVDLDARTVTLIDFGIAMRLDAAAAGKVGQGGLEGSLAYVAPEQTGRMDRGTDGRSDLYSFGVTLYELLTGTLPFRPADPAELLHAHLTRTPPPPAAVVPDIPAVLSALVMKLLEKAPEARYQSASGLLFDLERCLRDLRAAGRIVPFVLGSRDALAELSPPEGLYGRDAETAVLHQAMERVARGARELILVQGPSGIGKSALVCTLAPAVVARGGHFISGKCDQKGRSAPYAPIIDALRDLFGQIVMGSESARARLRDELCAALEPNGQLLIDLVPELQLVIGPQSRPPELEPAEAQNRLAVVLGHAFRALSAPDHPLVMFVDDLQWADPGTAWLLRVLFTGEAIGNLLVIGALRDDELPSGHPLPPALAALRDRALLTTLRLGPLSEAHLGRFVAEALRARDEQVVELAQLLFARTGGNPFFAYRFLRSIHDGSAIRFDAERDRFTIDRERLEAAWYEGGVVELLTGELQKLPAETRQVLVLAAALGHMFDRNTLSLLLGRTEAEIDAAMLPPLRAGHVLPVASTEQDAPGTFSGPVKARYRFAHDRLQQAAFLLVDKPARCKNAMQIGRLLLARAAESGRDEDLFDAADQLNEGSTLLADPDERVALAQTNLSAGRKARMRAAFEAAAKYFRAGVALLDEQSLEREHDLSFALHSELAECEAAQGEEHLVLDRLDRLDRQARSVLEQARVATIRVGLYVRLGQFPKAVAAGAPALRAFGLELPEGEPARNRTLKDVLARARQDLLAHPPASRLSALDMTDPEPLALERLLVALSVPAYFVDPALLGIVMIAWLDLVTEHGHSDLSAMGYASYGFFLSFFPERQRDAYEIGKLALALNEKRKNLALLCKVMETFAGNIAFLHEPLRQLLARFPAAMRAGLESGDFVHAAHICGHIVGIRLGTGDSLDALGEQVSEFLPLLERTNQTFSVTIMRLVKQVIKNLAGQTMDRFSLSDESVDEEQIAKVVASEGFDHLAAFYRTLRLMMLVVHGAWKEALVEAHAAEEKGPHAAGVFFFTDLTFFAALARVRAGREQPRDSPTLAGHIENLEGWAALCPANYRHKHLLILAELARMQGDVLAAMPLYDEAIDAAHDDSLLRDEALACELAAEFYLERGRTRIARAYAADAYDRYRAWGAVAKTHDMQRGEMRTLFRPEHKTTPPPPFAPALAPAIALTTTASEGVSALLDMSAVIRAAQTIASEIVLPRVIEKLLRIVASSAGAERGVLVLERDGTWAVAARIGLDGVETALEIPLDKATDLACSVVRHVARTKEPVVVADAARESRFALDPYVTLHHPKSILCMEMAQKGKRVGVMYLENNAVRGAFGGDRIRPLGILLSQAAIAIEIGRLYERVEAASEELRRTNAQLEDEVARRTAQLGDEFRMRAEAESERAKLAEEIIRVQEERITELLAPLLPITDNVLVMPLVGGVDAARAARVLEAALGGAAGWHAKVVIIDITGVKSAGEEVATGLLRTARALHLLGAEAIITGVRAEVAKTLVDLGADLGTLVTKSTLKAGIAHAMRMQK